jgi:uncharacterized protein YggU (UPF0235/DUF167 family)
MFSYRVTVPRTDSPAPAARIRIWAKPGSRRVEVLWDPWRERWTVAVPQPAIRGEANRAVLAVLAERLGVPTSDIRWVRAGTAAAKEAQVDGLTAAEVDRRLRTAGRESAGSAEGPP